jgi:hypothetical protein
MAKYDVFISYSRADTARVAPLREELRRLGYRVFFDTESIDPGQQWKRRLEGAIRASRVLVLCWSANVVGHEFITFEYSRAEALHKPVLPWLLDATPLPAMLEIQGITAADPAVVAARLKPALGWTLTRRRMLAGGLSLVAAILLCAGLWRVLNPPPPPNWDFSGDVIDRNTLLPIQGVEVDVMSGNEVEKSTQTDAQGHFVFSLPPPKKEYVQIRFSKAGYGGEQPLRVPTDKPMNMDMAKLP